MLIEPCDALAGRIARGVHPRRDPRYQVFYRSRRPEVERAVGELARYDPNLWVRWNWLIHRWEVWRWRQGLPPRGVLSSHEIVRRANFLWVLQMGDEYVPLDRRLVWHIWSTDSFRVHGTSDGGLIADAQNAIDIRDRLAVNVEATEETWNWAKDNKRQLRSYIGRSSVISVPRLKVGGV